MFTNLVIAYPAMGISDLATIIDGSPLNGLPEIPNVTFRFDFDQAKARQAIAVVLHHHNSARMNSMRLLKLLYLAERAFIKETGRPIIGAMVVAMERGPVVEEVYELIRGRTFHAPEFMEYFARDRFDIVMTADPGVGDLTEREIETLQAVAREHENEDEWDLVEFCHTLPEWKKNNPGKSSRPIPFDDILDALGMLGSKDEIIRNEALRREAMADIRTLQR